MKESIVFLDIDGVLNCRGTKDRIGQITGIEGDKIGLLKEIVDILDADIILTSTWREFWNENLSKDGITNWKGNTRKRYGRYLNLRFADYGLTIAGKTIDIHWSRRSGEVLEWLGRHPGVRRFAIIDDEDFRWDEYGLGRHWVSTMEERSHRPSAIGHGLTRGNVEYVRTHLEQFDKE